MVPKSVGIMEILEKGIVQFVSKEDFIYSNGYKLYKRGDGKKNTCLGTLPISFSKKIQSTTKLGARLTRNEINHVIKVTDDVFACFAFGSVYLIHGKEGVIEKIGPIKGSRPLCVCANGSQIYYGVYTSNEERNCIELFCFDIQKNEWSVFYTFDNIRHIHGVFWDNFESKMWVTTGDLDHESIIWRFNDNQSPEKIATGSQQTRTVDLLFTKEAIYYATDAPDEPNYIYRLDRSTGKKEQLQKVGGPVFYGCQTGNWMFFSTVVEPSKINRTDVVELWGSNNNGKNWTLIKEFKKDFLSKKLFQYGQIKLPYGPGDGKHLYFSPFATEYDYTIIKISLEEL
jgi:hypothetical protein